MRVAELSLTDFRCYEHVELAPAAGCTVVVGGNGQGKTSLLEAVGWAAAARSFRGVADAALVRAGADRAVLRARVVGDGGREQLVEAEIRAVGRNRVLLNRRPLGRARELLGCLRVTVFSPDDLALVKEGPAGRRDLLDELLVASAPRYEAARADYERVLRQRNALLRSGARDPEAAATLDVFDDQLVRAGAELVRGRIRLCDRLAPEIGRAYAALAGGGDPPTASYEAEWAEGRVPAGAGRADLEAMLRAALDAHRRQELDRGITLVGPHRDEWALALGGLPARACASQGEQRTLALAIRLAGHRVVAEVAGEEPVLLLDDVFSELDPGRAARLVASLPGTQTLVTTAGALPEGVHADQRLRVSAGRVEPVA